MQFNDNLTAIYKENLERDIIEELAEKKGISLREAMQLYYCSKLAEQVENGSFGIDNMSPKYLVEDLIETELDNCTAKKTP